MRVLKKAIMICLLTGIPLNPARCETLIVIDSITLSAQNADYPPDSTIGFYITEIYRSDNAVYAICDQRIIVRYSNEEQWRLTAGIEEYLAALGRKPPATQRDNPQFRPSHIWRMPSGELGLYDIWTCRFYSLYPDAPRDKRLRILKDFDEDLAISDLNVERDILLCGFYITKQDPAVGLLTPDLSKCRRIFDIPGKLRYELDSVGADYYPLPAMNPNDSAIWVSFRHHNEIFVINPNGQVTGRVPISDSDFVMPQPPLSRINSHAVFDDWYSKCSSIFSFQFAPPGYFLLQYSSPGERASDDRTFHSICWDANAKRVGLVINPEWRMKQVQADGTIPFVAYEREGEVVKKAVIYLTRIMP